jgi:hypothetical protein
MNAGRENAAPLKTKCNESVGCYKQVTRYGVWVARWKAPLLQTHDEISHANQGKAATRDGSRSVEAADVKRKNMKRIWLMMLLFAGITMARGELSDKVAEPQSTGSKALVKLTMKNTYTNAVESARAVVFLLDAKGKVVGQRAEWVIGGTREKPGLAAGGTAVFNLLITADKPVERASVKFTRIILEGGRLVESGTGVELAR